MSALDLPQTTPSQLANSDVLERLSVHALTRCGVDPLWLRGTGNALSPLNGIRLQSYAVADENDIQTAVSRAQEAFEIWRSVPAPSRAALLKRFVALVEQHMDDLARLITLEVGKVPAEARGELREMLEMCDFAVGLTRRLNGHTLPSQRPGFRLTESWHPMGVVAVISPFSFPAAVWAWSAPVALACGNPVIWKPSEHAPLSALGCAVLLDRAAADVGAPRSISQVLLGDSGVGQSLADHSGVALVNVSGSTATGRSVGPRVAARFGRCLLHLSGNNASIVAPSADLDLAVEGIVAAATSAAGQRCTTMRRLIVHRSISEEIITRLSKEYDGLVVGNPFQSGTRVGPLRNRTAFDRMSEACEIAQQQGGELVVGGERQFADSVPDAYYVRPAVIRMPEQSSIVQQETVAPLLFLLEYEELSEAVRLNNAVPQGFSSSIYTRDHTEAELFLSASGSDCGIVNVNLHTSGAEVGTAFGGEKETGGGRQCGSDVWRSYMRRATSAIG